jgi:hypothetical protein
MNFKQSFIAIYFIWLNDLKYAECREWVSFHLEYLLCHPSDILEPEVLEPHTHPAVPVVTVITIPN